MALAARAVRFLRAAEPRARPSRAGLGLDVALAAVLTLAVVVTMNKAGRCDFNGGLNECVGPASGGRVSHHLPIAGVLIGAPLALRRVRPLTAFWVIVAAAALISPNQSDNIFTLLAVVIAGYSAIVHGKYRQAAMVSLPLAGLLVATAFPTVAQPLQLPGRATALWALIPVVIVGRAVDQWRQRAGVSQARLDQLQAEHEAATALAVAREQARIAAELHDVVTHNVSVMIVQAGAARQVLTHSPAEATDALLAVEASGRAAMSELRHLLGLLSPATAADGAGPDADLRPQPGLGQLAALVGRVRAAGLDVDLRTGPLPALLPGQDLAAYRVIQEALTNVIKHAGMAWTTVSLGCQQGRLTVEVVNAAPAVAGSRAVHAPPVTEPGPAGTGPGRGLIGLRERVGLYGGEFSAGPRPAGGWLVRASLPVDEQSPLADPAGASDGARDGARPPGTSDGARDGARSDGASDGARSNGARSDGARSDGARSDGIPAGPARSRRAPPDPVPVPWPARP